MEGNRPFHAAEIAGVVGAARVDADGVFDALTLAK